MEKLDVDEDDYREPIPGEYGNPIPRELFFRELGFANRFSRFNVGKRAVSRTFATKAAHTFATKENFSRRKFKLPHGARTTFHMAFSPDGTKVASCHGDHNIYVCDVRSGEVLQMLTGHPRTPWCVVFHPTQNDVLASGCLAGHIRVWDLNGGSEVLVTDSGTVIASLAFHPTVRLLVIATFNEIMFWDWNLPYPLARCSTENPKEKVRLVRFDRLGKSLITGITNYPHPPTREGLSNTAGTNHRPSILTRNIAGPSGNAQDYASVRSTDVPTREPVRAGQARSNRQTGGSYAGAGMAHLAASLAAAAEAEAASAVLNRRQDRFQESYRQLVTHYQDLVTHYQQFLRSRIPRLLETSRLVRDPPETSSLSEPPVVPVTNPEIPQPLENLNDVPGPRRLAQIERRLQEIMNNPEVSASLERSRSNANSASSSTGSSAAVPGPSRLRNDSDLRNIEMLAQNILEMQNLCSQARRDAPVTIETQHIIELQNIRRHLEMLQEQTRDLQSSIRATLTSLARNSLDALRSQADVSSPASSALNSGRGRMNLDMLRGGSGSSQTGPLNTQPPLYYPNNASSITNTGPAAAENGNSSAGTNNSSSAILRITIGPRLSANSEIPPSTSVSASRANSNRNQPSSGATTMHYEIPIPVTSRQSNNSNTTGEGDRTPVNLRRVGAANGESGTRRVTHEYYIGARREHLMEQHARNCPFNSRDQMTRPPPRLRCLSDMGQSLNLTVWPTMDSDSSEEITQITDVPSNRRRNNSENSATALLALRGQENSLLSSVSSLVVPHQIFAGRLNWISNDMGVHMQLLMRQLASRSRTTSGYSGTPTDEDRENWQRCFMGGYALVPQWSRRGERPEVDLQQVLTQGSATPAATRLNSRITYREDGTVVFNLRNPSVSTPTSTSSAIDTQPGTNSDAPIVAAQILPQQLPGGFSMVYRMRIGDEIIPVFTSPDNAAASFSTHILEGPLPNVFVLPIGLFLRGISWENNTESIGIYWPPSTRDEEENLISISSRTSDLVRVYSSPSRHTYLQESQNQIARHRVAYDNNQLSISVSDGAFITFEQPGILLLDLISSMSVLPRPRPLQGVVYVNYVSSVLFAVERLFANRPTSASFSSAGASNGNASGFSAARMARNPYRSPQPLSRSWIGSHPMSNADSGSRAPDSPSAAFSFTLAEPRIHLERVDQMLLDRRRRIVQAINEENANRANSSAMNVNGATAGPSTRYRLQSSAAATGNIPAVSESAPTDGRASPGPRRIIRLAVDASTGEIRREPPYSRSNVDLTRAIESRIERVLNERGNRGIDVNSSSYQNSSTGGSERGTNGLDEEARERQVRLEDIQLRICMLAQWPSRQVSSVSSATQTVGGNDGEQSNSSSRRDMSTNTTAPTATEPRPLISSGTGQPTTSTTTLLRRRNDPEDNSNDEDGRPTASRRPRLDGPVHTEDNSQQASVNGSHSVLGNPVGAQGPSVSMNVTPLGRQSPSPATPNDTDIYLSRLRSALRSHWERNARRLARPYGNPAEHRTPALSRYESRLANPVPGTDSNRPYSNSTASQSNSTLTSTVQSNQMPRVAVPAVFSSVPQNATSETATRAQPTSMTSGEPVLFQLPDFFAPLEVSRVENSAEATGSSRDSESSRLQESHLILEPSIDGVLQDDRNAVIPSPVYEAEIHPDFGTEVSAGSSADDVQILEERSELPYQRLRQALASANSVLERIGEAAVRETISALNSENNIPGSGPLEGINVPTVPTYGDPTEAPEASYLRDPRLPFSPPPIDTDSSTIGVSAIDEATARNAANAVGDFLHMQEAPEPQVVLPLIDPLIEIDPSELLINPNSLADEEMRTVPEVPPIAERPGRQPSRSVSEWYLRRRAPTTQARIRVTFRSGNSHDMNQSTASGELPGSARTRIGINVSSASASNIRPPPRNSQASAASDGRGSYHRRRPEIPENISPYLRFVHNYAGSAGGAEDGLPPEAGARYYPGYVPDIASTSSPAARARPQTYYTMDAATTAFLSSRIQKWDFSDFCIPDITDRTFGLITSSCSLLSDSTLDVSSDSEFIAVLQPSDNGSYSAVGIYSLKDESLGDNLYTYHFDQNTVSVSISPSCDYIVVGYAGRGAFYRIIHPSRHIGQILSLTRDGLQLKLVPVKDVYADTHPALMSVNCMQWVPVPGYGIVYGTNTGEVVLLS